jgi:hypothetical protein
MCIRFRTVSKDSVILSRGLPLFAYLFVAVLLVATFVVVFVVEDGTAGTGPDAVVVVEEVLVVYVVLVEQAPKAEIGMCFCIAEEEEVKEVGFVACTDCFE